MAESYKTERIFFDGPTKGLLGLVGGLAALIVGLSLRAYIQLPKTTGVAITSVSSPRPAPTPASARALKLFDRQTLLRTGWQIVGDDTEAMELHAPSGAIFQQRLLPLSEGLSPRTIVTRLDERLARWGQEYQRVQLETVERGGLKMTSLEYALNLPGKPTQRTHTIVGRVRVNGERRVAIWTLAAPEEAFDDDQETLSRGGVPL